MLRNVEDRASIVVCNTCRFSVESQANSDGQRGGALFAAQLRSPGANVAIEETQCLFACTRHCTVHLRAPGKIGYVLGDFKPTAEDAAAILAFFLLYQDSEVGAVPYSKWPAGVKGHFIVRVPPTGFVTAQ